MTFKHHLSRLALACCLLAAAFSSRAQTVGLLSNESNTNVVTAEIIGTLPILMGYSVDNTNQPAGWISGATNLTVDLGVGSGLKTVWFWFQPSSGPVFSNKQQIYLHPAEPVITLLSPTNLTVASPWLQLSLHFTKSMADLSVDVTGATNTVTNIGGFVSFREIETNVQVFNGSIAKVPDVPLELGTNTLTVRSRDDDGNEFTSTLTIIYDPTIAVGPPPLELLWPPANGLLAATNATIRGTTSPSVKEVYANVIWEDGTTNRFDALVETDGAFWVDDAIFNSTSNRVELVAVDYAGNTTNLAFDVFRSDLQITVNELSEEALRADIATITGTISQAGYRVWVNGVEATIEAGTWTATNVLITAGGMASFHVTAIPSYAQPVLSPAPTAQPTKSSVFALNPTANVPTPQMTANPERPYRVVISSQVLEVAYNHPNFFGDMPEVQTYGHIWSDYTGGKAEGRTVAFDGGFWQKETNKWIFPLHYIPMGSRSVELKWFDDPIEYYNYPIYYRPPMYVEKTKFNRPAPDGTETRDCITRLVLETGGRRGINRQNLFSVAVGAKNHPDADVRMGVLFPPEIQFNPNDPDIPKQQLLVLGKYAGADGYVYKVLPDNAAVDITVRFPNTYKYVTFDVAPTKHRLVVYANSIILRPDRPVASADFCVGQKITFDWLIGPQAPIATVNWTRWSLTGKYVNEHWRHTHMVPDGNGVPYPEEYGSDNYRVNPSLLQQPSTSAWWVQGGWVRGTADSEKQATLLLNVTLNNGERFTLTSLGKFDMHRPRVGQWVPLYGGVPNLYSDQSHLALGDWVTGAQRMTFTSRIAGRFTGKAGYTQLMNGLLGTTFWASDTGGAWNLDNLEWPRGQQDVYPSTAGSNPGPYFDDGPGIGYAPLDLSAYYHVSFKDFLRFRPDAGNANQNIFVTLQEVDWRLSASSTKTGGVWSLDPSSYFDNPVQVSSDNFPYWESVSSNLFVPAQ